ncbi:MAG: FtsQ-type POTRA domain-containing protein [Deltaproteobacteria bacterium]|nr:FtsQ-type POTRA domain-containing protein [Deltaproteobacteria bacterium]
MPPRSRLAPQRPVKKGGLLTGRAGRNSYRRRPRLEGKRLWLRILLVTLGLAGLGGASLGLLLLYHHLLTSPLFCIKDIRDIDIDGAERLSHQQVLELARVGQGTNLLALHPSRAEQALLSHPWIVRAEVTRRWPNRLHIKLEEREPVALVQLGELYYIDRRGALFKPASPADPHDFPVVTGLGQEHFVRTAGAPSRVVEQILQLLELLKEARPPLNLENISEIHVDPERGFTLYANGLASAIDLGLAEFPERLAKFGRVWPVLSQKGLPAKLARINLDFPQRVLLTLKGAEDSQ